MKFLKYLRAVYNRVFIPVQGTHELLKNPVTIPEQSAPSHSLNPSPAPPSLRPWVEELKQEKNNARQQ